MLSTVEYDPGLSVLFPGDDPPADLAAAPRSFNFAHADGKPHPSEIAVDVKVITEDQRTRMFGEVNVFDLNQSNASCKRSPEFVDVRTVAIASMTAFKTAQASNAEVQSLLRRPGSASLLLQLPNVVSGPENR